MPETAVDDPIAMDDPRSRCGEREQVLFLRSVLNLLRRMARSIRASDDKAVNPKIW